MEKGGTRTQSSRKGALERLPRDPPRIPPDFAGAPTRGEYEYSPSSPLLHRSGLEPKWLFPHSGPPSLYRMGLNGPKKI